MENLFRNKQAVSVGFIAALFFGVSLSSAGVLPKHYYRDPLVTAFEESGRVSDFQKIDEDNQRHVIANMMVYPECTDSVPCSPEKIQQQQSLFKNYFGTASAENINATYQTAYLLALESGNPKVARDIFSRRAAHDPKIAQKYICSAVSMVVTSDEAGQIVEMDDGSIMEAPLVDEERLSIHADFMATLIPMIAQSDRLAEKSCNLGEPEGEPKLLTLSQIYMKASPELHRQLYNQTRQVQPVDPKIVQHYAACTYQQIRYYVFNVLEPLQSAKVGSSGYVIGAEGSCLINGLIKKTNSGYEFAPSHQIVGYLKKTIPFSNLEDLVRQMKGTTSVTPKKQVVQSPVVVKNPVVLKSVQSSPSYTQKLIRNSAVIFDSMKSLFTKEKK